MWWEILPSSVAFVACLLLPNYIAYPWHYFSQNKHVCIIFYCLSCFEFISINFCLKCFIKVKCKVNV